MIIDDGVLTGGEKISLSLRALYREYGYKPYKMSKFEEYGLYADNKEFLVSDDVITFTDKSGKLMALKPDVTLSIIKNSAMREDVVNRVYYSENVYRAEKGSEDYKEIMQTGLECFGAITDKDVAEVVLLAAKSLKSISGDCALTVSDISVLSEIIGGLNLSRKDAAAVFKAVSERNLSGIKTITVSCENKGKRAALIKLLSVGGKIKDVINDLSALSPDIGLNEYDEFIKVMRVIAGQPDGESVYVDFSLTGDANYYSGIIFRGFINGVPAAVLSGGRYDNLMKKLGKNSGAIGFAVYVDMLERLINAAVNAGGGYINVALPKGRLGEKVYSLFEKAGYECPAVLNPKRKLILSNDERKIRFFWVKPTDVTIYVERGAADVGVAGKDTIEEYEPDVYELLDLKEGVCKMAVAAPVGFDYASVETLRVATKFKNVAKKFYLSRAKNVDVIKLNGSIEIAPLLKISDVIVDIVETGATLKENGLSVVEEVFPISARLIANKSAYKFKEKEISVLLEKLTEVVENEK